MDAKRLYKTVYQKNNQGFTGRMRLAVNELKDGDVVLEVGVGRGELTRNVGKLKNVRLYAVDIAEEALNSVKTYLEDGDLVNLSSERTKYQDNFFDVVICLEVFEHLDNPYHALMEIQRVLKPDGKLLLSVPNHAGGHIMIYPGLITQKFFRLFLRQNYFQIVDFKLWGPVWNKDNVGVLLESKVKSELVRTFLLRGVQVLIRILHFISSLFFIKASSLYWCYFYVCRNKKSVMEKPLWVKQLEQTSELGRQKGWYNEYYHRKA